MCKFEFEFEYVSKNINLPIIIYRIQVKCLEYLSTKNVLHNDIKPHNLFYRNRDVFIGGKFLL